MGFLFNSKKVKEKLTITREDITFSDVISIIASNLFEAIIGAIFVYIGIWFAIILASLFNIPSLTALLFMWIVESIIELVFSSEGLEVINTKVETVELFFGAAMNFIYNLIDKYGWHICYFIAFCDGVMDDLGMYSLKERIIKLWERTIEWIF